MTMKRKMRSFPEEDVPSPKERAIEEPPRKPESKVTTQFIVDGKRVSKVTDPKSIEGKLFPEKLGVNLKTGQVEVSIDFFWQVFREYSNDDSWHCWICTNDKDEICGVIVLQTFVHESSFFKWGPPLSKISKRPNEAGEIVNIGEISVFCAKQCGSLLIKELEDFVVRNTSYDALVVASTPGALEWYRNKGYKDVNAYRMDPTPGQVWEGMHNHQSHRYRHRINDLSLDVKQDPPSAMLFKLKTAIIKNAQKTQKVLESAPQKSSEKLISEVPNRVSAAILREGKHESEDYSPLPDFVSAG
eukprot:TRINITY_DN317_c0_g1_i1.p1 TRINITY_DN317_c0_g1~~TRINITY_DN317_c0_g1_i1.p1  ORF type:complete len:301 (+),score=50.40 TRINITY_DN317_c0_g1_i1:322-1224(+)